MELLSSDLHAAWAKIYGMFPCKSKHCHIDLIALFKYNDICMHGLLILFNKNRFEIVYSETLHK